MSDPIRWTAAFDVRWRPMLTYGVRRLSLLEWFEDNLDVVEFHESDHIGVAVGSPATRLMVSDESLTLLLRTSDADATALEKAVAGVLEILEPKGTIVGKYRAAWSQELELDHSEACARLAGRATGDISSSGIAPIDCAVLADFRTPSGHSQVDFGVVSETELRSRLVEMESRVGGAGFPRPWNPGLPTRFAASSLFADLSWHAHSGQEEYVEGAADVTKSLAKVESEAAGLVSALKAAL